MPFAPVTLKPGVNVEATATALRAGYAQSNLGRYRAGFFEKLGGFVKFFAFALSGVPRALHAWQDLNGQDRLAVGTSGIAGTAALDVITSDVLSNITPQTFTSDVSPDFATTASSANVNVTDANLTSPVTTTDTIELKTPIAVGGIILSGTYPIDLSLGATNYRIVAADNAVTTRGNATITGITAANPGSVSAASHGFSTGDLIYISGVVGMTQVNNRLFSITSTGAGTFTIGVDTSAYTAYASGGVASPSAVPFFTTTVGSSLVTVTFQDHGLSAGGTIVFPLATVLQKSKVTITNASPGVVTWLFPSAGHGMTGGEAIVFTTTGTLPTGLTAGTTYYVLVAGLTTTTFRVSATVGGTAINTSSAGSGIHTGTVGSFTLAAGTYSAVSVTDVDNFVIAAAATAAANSVVPNNGGNAEIVYYIALGPVAGGGTGYSINTYSSGPYSGTGSGGSQMSGTAIAATDWTLDNWGSTLIANPADGGVYQWTPGSGQQNAELIAAAPIYASGILISTPAQILLAYGVAVEKDIGVEQDPNTYSWSDQLDFEYWTPNITNPSTGIASQAGNNRIPTGSAIKAGLAAPQQTLLWTDLDLWAISYVGPPGTVFSQTKIGGNCGAISRHGVAQMGGIVYWWSSNNFYALTGGGPQVIPCTVWDNVFQNIDRDNLDKTFIETVTSFNEVWFFYPSADGTGNCDSYAKVNVLDGAWDYGSLPRSIGIDQSVLGQPIMATPTGIIYSHETGYDADGQPLSPAFQTGYFYLSEGEDFVFVDQFYPDFKYQTSDGSTTSATVQVTFYVIDNPGDTPRTYGPYSMSTSTNKLDVRFRGRQFAIAMTSTDTGSWWRMGQPRFRVAIMGRR